MEWQQGRNLFKSSSSSTNTTIISTIKVDTDVAQTYTYDADGIRTGKTSTTKVYKYRSSIGGGEIMTASADPDATLARYLYSSTTVNHSYITQNGKVVRETIGSGTTAKVLDFIYDESGKPFALKYTNGTATPATYYYVLNLQGDVVGLIDASGVWYAQYSYNAWGEITQVLGRVGNKLLSVQGSAPDHIANINPLRYRGYYYDTETGWYYLQSRYYDPVTHRFINADSLASTGQGFTGTNMFAYCNNNSIMLRDNAGQEPVETLDTDGDGTIDCYIYEYVYYVPVVIPLGTSFITLHVPRKGYVCFFVGLKEDDFDAGVDLPGKYDNCILIGDFRAANPNNPSMQVYESYKVTNKYQASAIIDTMLLYDEENPTSNYWGRTKDSMLFEWSIHNLGYAAIRYKTARSTDFDRKEEGYTVYDYCLKFINAIKEN